MDYFVVSIIDFEQLNVGWVGDFFLKLELFQQRVLKNCSINPFVLNVPFLYSLKTENFTVF